MQSEIFPSPEPTPVISEPCFIGLAGPPFRHGAAAQKYVFDQATQGPNAPRVPKTYDTSTTIVAYLTMEYYI